MSTGGYFKVHRKIADNGLFRDNHSARHLFLDLLRMAAYRDTTFDWRGQPIEVKRGQLMISLPRLAKETGFSVRTVRTLLAHMASHGVLKIDTPADTLPTRLTICKYEQYQGSRENTDTPADTQATRKRKKERNKKEEEDTLASQHILTVSVSANEREGLAGQDLASLIAADVADWMAGGDEASARQWLRGTAAAYGNKNVRDAWAKLKADMAAGAIISHPLKTLCTIAQRLKDNPPAEQPGKTTSTKLDKMLAGLSDAQRALLGGPGNA